MIYPNPLNPKRYVVLNSGFTFSFSGGTNSLQITRLGRDHLSVSRNGHPKGVLNAGFFDEFWQFKDKPDYRLTVQPGIARERQLACSGHAEAYATFHPAL